MSRILDRKAFARDAAAGKAPQADGQLRKEFAAVECAADDAMRTVTFTITTNDPDRDNDVVAANGWDLADYVKSPVVLWAHDYRCAPIAKAISVTSTANGLQSTAQFPPNGVYPFADMVFELIKGGYIKACSVGFRAIEWTYDEKRGGVNFVKQTLLEWSIVPVPANPHALVAASADGVDLGLLGKWIGGVLADWPGDLVMPGKAWRKVLEAKDGEDEPEPVADPVADPVAVPAAPAAADQASAEVTALKAQVDALQGALAAGTADAAKQAEAVAALVARLDAADAAAAKAAEQPAADDIVFELADDDPNGFDIDPAEFRSVMGDVVSGALRLVAADAAKQTMNRLRGRLD